MSIVEQNIILKVSTESLFQYLKEPPHLTELCQNVIEVNDVERHTAGTKSFAWVYKMMGVHIFGEAEFYETQHNRGLNIRFWGGIHGNIIWQFQPVEENLLLKFRLDYIIPTPLLKKHSEDAILRQNEQDVENMLINLKTLMESHHARTVNRM